MLKKYNTLPELSEALLTSNPNPLYWHILFNNSLLVITQVALTDQRVVAPSLGMSQSKLSQITVILKEFAHAEQA